MNKQDLHEYHFGEGPGWYFFCKIRTFIGLTKFDSKIHICYCKYMYSYKWKGYKMRTFSKVLLIVISVLFLFLLSAYADEGIVEYPKSHVYLNNTDLNFNGTIIVKEDCVMLPLYQITSKLGIKNDYEHITYDYVNNSIIVNLNNKKLVITTDNKTASIDGKEYQLDVAPFKYKNRQVYVPAYFIAQAFNKVYAWDSFSQAVLLGDSKKSDKPKQILEKSIRAMKQLKRVKLKYYEFFYIGDGINTAIKNLDIKIDRQNKQMRISETMDYNGKRDFEMVYYYFDNGYISSHKNSGYWGEEIILSDINREFNQYEVNCIVLPDEQLYSNLSVLDSVDRKYYILTGNARPHRSSELIGGTLDVNRDNHTTIVINKSNYLISNIEFKNKYYNKETNKVVHNTTKTYDFSDYDGNFNAKVPKELISNFKIVNPDNKIIAEEHLNISVTDKKKIDVLAKNSFVSCVDSFFSSPYKLEFNEGILFVNLKDQKDYKEFNNLSEEGKKLLSLKILNNNYNQLLGSETIKICITYNGKVCYFVPARWDIREVDYVEPIPIGQKMDVIIQDRKNNTYSTLKR